MSHDADILDNLIDLNILRIGKHQLFLRKFLQEAYTPVYKTKYS